MKLYLPKKDNPVVFTSSLWTTRHPIPKEQCVTRDKSGHTNNQHFCSEHWIQFRRAENMTIKIKQRHRTKQTQISGLSLFRRFSFTSKYLFIWGMAATFPVFPPLFFPMEKARKVRIPRLLGFLQYLNMRHQSQVKHLSVFSFQIPGSELTSSQPFQAETPRNQINNDYICRFPTSEGLR